MISLTTFQGANGVFQPQYQYKLHKLIERRSLNSMKSHHLSDCKKQENPGEKYVKDFLDAGYVLDFYCTFKEHGNEVHHFLFNYRSNEMVEFGVYEGATNISIYARDPETLAKAEERLQTLLPVKLEDDPSMVKFSFWRYNPNHGALDTNRKLECPLFTDIQSNYNALTRSEVEKLMGLEDPHKHGSIVLWHGPPGTGKTHMIRAFARHWRKTYDSQPEVILDPERIFEDPNYLFDVLIYELPQNRKKPRLIIMEDSAELFTNEARNKTGFGRLLNVTDGLIGQGQRLVFLFTANEKIEQIDNALLRSGRCLQELYFPALDMEAATNWAKANGFELNAEDLKRKEMSLADLYAKKRGEDNHKESESRQLMGTFGFGA